MQAVASTRNSIQHKQQPTQAAAANSNSNSSKHKQQQTQATVLAAVAWHCCLCGYSNCNNHKQQQTVIQATATR